MEYICQFELKDRHEICGKPALYKIKNEQTGKEIYLCKRHAGKLMRTLSFMKGRGK